MKPINEFTNEILSKSKLGRVKNNVIKAIVSVVITSTLIFLVAYSNIITFNNFSNSTIYKRYMQSYQSNNGDTSFKIIDSKTAVVTVSEKVYACSLIEESNNAFSLYDEKNKTQNLSVVFENDTAKLSGEIENTSVNKTLNVVTDMKVQEGVYSMFATETNGEIVNSLSNRNWFLINEKQSYVGENNDAYACEFIMVGSKVLQRSSDQISGLSEFSLFEILPTNKFGFFAIKNTLYESENDELGYVSYYKKLSTTEDFGFSGGTFETDLVTYKNKTQRIDEKQVAFDEGVAWRLSYIPNVEETFFKIKLKLNLFEDGSLRFESTETQADMIFKHTTLGRWYNLKHRVLVVLDDGYTFFNFKAFVIYGDESSFSKGDFLQTAKSSINALACYKTGYHTFNYYMSDANATVYWGSSWSKEDLMPVLYYDTEYVFNGWQSNWHKEGENFERIPITESMATSIIFKKDGKCEVYRNGEFWLNVKYNLVEYDKYRYRIEFDGFIMLFDDNETKIKFLYVGAKSVSSSSSAYDEVDGNRLVKNKQILFTTS